MYLKHYGKLLLLFVLSRHFGGEFVVAQYELFCGCATLVFVCFICLAYTLIIFLNVLRICFSLSHFEDPSVIFRFFDHIQMFGKTINCGSRSFPCLMIGLLFMKHTGGTE